MLAPSNYRLCHAGDIPFIKPWKDWYGLLGRALGVQFDWQELSAEAVNTENFKTFDLIRINTELAPQASALFNATSPFLTELQYVDLITRKNTTIWPHLLHKEAMQSVILSKHPQLNTKGAGLIVGESAQAILGGRTLVELGIKHITFVLEDLSIATEFIRKASQSLFEVQFEVVSKDQVILLPGIYSVVACYRDLSHEPSLMEGLLYFSYLIHGGLVIMNAPMELKALREEASAINANVIDFPTIQFHEAIMAINKIIPIKQEVVSQFEQAFQSLELLS